MLKRIAFIASTILVASAKLNIPATPEDLPDQLNTELVENVQARWCPYGFWCEDNCPTCTRWCVCNDAKDPKSVLHYLNLSTNEKDKEGNWHCKFGMECGSNCPYCAAKCNCNGANGEQYATSGKATLSYKGN